MHYHEVGELISALWERYPTASVDSTTIEHMTLGLSHVAVEDGWSAVRYWTVHADEWPTLADLLDVVAQTSDGMLGVRHSAWQSYELHTRAHGGEPDEAYFRAEWAVA